jgi:aliphatic sulfonates family ABC transporter substrate-binding protein
MTARLAHKGAERINSVIRSDQRVGVDAVVGAPRQAARATAMVFEDPRSLALRDDLLRIAPSDATVLVIGETGTGKELVARYIHAHSARRKGPFIAVNCGAFSDSLAEAELFGHEKGAFTGALKSQMGWFEAANGGTLLLDEIGDLALPLQVKLLRVLQEREIVRVGSRRPIPIDVRVIAATNVDLESAIRAKLFRRDLYYRLNVATIKLAPLRERLADVRPLARYFLDRYAEKLGRRNLVAKPSALRALEEYHWPGNIRELENVIHNSILLSNGNEIETFAITPSVAPRPEPACDENFVEGLQKTFEAALGRGEPELFERVTNTLVRTAFDFAGGNQVRAAERLGLSRNAFRTHLSHLGVIAPRRKSATPQHAEKARERIFFPSSVNEIRIGYQTFGTLSTLKAYGSLENLFAEHGFQAVWIEFPSGPQLLDALGRGEIDFGATGETPPVFAQAAGASFFYVGYEPPAPASEAIIVSENSPIRSIEDLKGKRIALNRWSNVHYLLLRALSSVSLDLTDIRPVYLPPSLALLNELHEGNIDAWAIWDPLLTAARRSHRVRVLADGRGLAENHQFYLSRKVFAFNNPHIIELILDDIRLAGTHIRAHSAEVAQKISPQLHLTSDVVEDALARLSYSPRSLDGELIDKQQRIADLLFSLGQLPSSISVREAVWQRAESLVRPVEAPLRLARASSE